MVSNLLFNKNSSGFNVQRSRNTFTVMRLAMFFLLMMLVAIKIHAAVDAELDRDQVSEGDTIALTIRVSGDNDAEPDLTVLEKSFDIVSQSQSSSFTFSNYKQNSSREWRLQMFPKSTGTLTIPEITIGNEKTPALQVQVKQRNTQAEKNSSGNADPVFIKVSLDADSAYVQQEVIITAQVYQAVQLDNMQMSDPEFDNANVKKINQTSYQTTENGLAYRVHEIRYALYPREAGDLIIPEFVFNARAFTDPASFFNMSANNSIIRRMSKPLRLKVKPIPANFTGKIWLPARSLRLKEEWRDDQSMAQTGKAITRSVVIEANGLLSAQLPELPKQSVDGLQMYPDQPLLADQDTANGIRSTREEPVALIPTKPGTITLPEIRVAWWDVDNDQQKEAVLPASQLTATGQPLQDTTALQSATGSSANNATQNSNSDNTEAEKKSLSPQASASNPDATNQIWKWVAMIAIAGWTITLVMWFLSSRRQGTPGQNTKNIKANYQTDEQVAFNRLRDCCRNNSVKDLRHELLHWAASTWPDTSQNTLDEISQRIGSVEFTRIIQQLDAQLYSATPDYSTINCEALLSAIDKWRTQRKMKATVSSPIPELYEQNT
jgi:hypothetical protein